MAVRGIDWGREKFTCDDLWALPDDGVRRELIDGQVYVTPSPAWRHQELVLRLAVALKLHSEAHGGGAVSIAPFDVILSGHDVVQPDVLFVADDDQTALTAANLQGPPTIVAEVVSDPARDRRIKLGLYAAHRVKEYWVVDPEADQVEVHRLGPEGYGKAEVCARAGP